MGKIITVPKPRDISFHMTINGAQVSSENSFESFLMDALDYGGPQDDKKEIRKARKVYEKLQTSEETKPDTLVLEDEEFALLEKAVSVSLKKGVWRPIAARNFLPFMDAMEKENVQDVPLIAEPKK